MVSKKKSKSKQIPVDDGFLMSPKNDFAFKLIFGDEKNKDLLMLFSVSFSGYLRKTLKAWKSSIVSSLGSL